MATYPSPSEINKATRRDQLGSPANPGYSVTANGTSYGNVGTQAGGSSRYGVYGDEDRFTPHTPYTEYMRQTQGSGGTGSTPSTPGTPGSLPGGLPGSLPGLPGTTPESGNDGTPDNPGGFTGYSPGLEKPGYTAPTLPGANSQADYINAMYDANRRAQEDALRNAYEQQVNVYNDQVNRLPAAYNAAADQVAAQAAIQQRNFNEQAAASGLNTGAGSQARLAQNNAYLGNIREVRQAQADAEANLNLQRAQLETQYRNAIADAIAQNDLQRAQALYQEAVRVDESLVNTAINQANMDWSVWNALYNK